MFKKRIKSDKSAIRLRSTEEVDEDTVVVRPSAPQGASTASTTTTVNSSDGASLSVAAIYSSSGDTWPQQYAGNATHTSEIDTAIEK